jgi:(1->4)-alpha-D-glucan 1-alpha-D-glucosylmutase
VSVSLRGTYRLQLGPQLTFDGARELVPYLRELGVSHLYLSPILQARKGSTHGYDGVDPRRISADLGGEEGFRALAAEAARNGLGILLDVVPNHLAASDQNELWRDPELRRKVFDVDPETGRHRRFFDVDELAGVRVEDPDVFELTHHTVLALVAAGLVHGLRIDHPDGLADPRGYLERLRDAGAREVWVEKILEPGEHLRGWPIEGTTGYEFLNDAQALFVDPAGERALTALAREDRSWHDVASEAELEQAQTTFTPEVERLRRLLDVPELPQALASLPVYRTYVEPWSGRVADADRAALAHLPPGLQRVLLLEERGHDEFVTRFQQTSGPVMAKGVEDTAFYRYVRLLALNEVGGNPGRFALSVEGFHEANAYRAAHFPSNLLAGTTHDTKRSADVRARIGALAGMADEWAEHVLRWHNLTGGTADWSEELLIYQTLVGAWPISAERLCGYLEKALREAKRNTSWLAPNEEWEHAVQSFAVELLTNDRFLADFVPFAASVAAAGERSALGQLVLRFTVPGVPDLYNGDELPYLALVDPDNRRPVDWDACRSALARGDVPKLNAIRALLALRARRPDCFDGAYEPLEAPADTCAYVRGGGVLVAVDVRGRDVELAPPRGTWSRVLELPGAVVYEQA